MAKQRHPDRHIFFPWEKRRGMLRRIRVDQAGAVVLALWSLALLLVTFLSRHMSDNAAIAQVTRRPPEYVMIPGEISGGSSAVIFVVDTANGELGGLSYDNNTLRLDAMSTVDIGRIFEQGAAGATPARPGSVPGTGATGSMRK